MAEAYTFGIGQPNTRLAENTTGAPAAFSPSPPGTSLVDTAGNTLFRSQRRTQVPFKLWGLVQNSAGVLGITNRVVYEVPNDWIALRVHVENMASTAQINRIASVGVGADASVLASASATFSSLLFSASATHATTACTSGAGTDQAIPTDLVSDWLALPSIPRTDGGSGRLICYQEFVPSAGNTTGNRVDIASTSLALSVTRAKAYYKSGDCVTTPANFTSATEWTMAPAVWFEFLTTAGQIVVLGIGDSTVQGSDGGPPPNVGGALRSLFEASPTTIAICNEGWASQTSAAYYTNGVAKLSAIKGTLAVYCPWSPNDSDKYTAAGVTRMQQAALQFITACQAAGVVPALLTPCPANGLNSTQEGFRRQIVAWAKLVCASNIAILVDRDAVYTDYSTDTGGYKAGLNATTLHPNATGYALEATTAWAPAVARLIS